MNSARHQPAGSPVALRPRQLAAVVAGNALEFYDFMTYAFFAAQIGRVFFPSQNPMMSLLMSLATFGAGFLTRPVGAYVIGRFADRVGRKPAMILSFVLMGVSIGGLALTPSYLSIGVAAPVLVVFWRLLQGFALGAEVGPTAAFLVEAAPPERRGIFGSLLVATSGISVFTAGLVGFGLSSALDAQALDSWGWRCAFLLGVAVVPVGLAIRRSLPETLHAPQIATAQVSTNRTSYATVAFLSLAMLSSGTIITYVRAYLTTYSVSTLGITSQAAFVCTMLNGLCTVIFYLLGGWLSDRLGRRRVMIVSTALLAVCVLPTFLALVHFRSPAALYAATILLTALGGLSQAAVITAIIESLPRHARAGALGTIYALSVAIFGGSTQFMVAWLIGISGSLLVPGWYMLGAALLGLGAMVMMRETAPAMRPSAN